MIKYYYAGATRLAMRTGLGTGTTGLNWLLSDHPSLRSGQALGSTSITADASGNKAAELRYKAWGETRYTYGTTPTKRQYTGQISEMATIGLYFYRARFYDPVLSRFTSADSIVPLASQGVQAWDRYAFVNNNPLRYNDPTGHMVRSDTDESGCSGRNPSCIIDMYSQSGDFEGMDDSLRNYVRRNPNYNIYADVTLDDSQRFLIANTQFQVAAKERNFDFVWSYGISVGLLGIVAGGGDTKPQGGVYYLSNSEGRVLRVGRTNNFSRRSGQYSRDAKYFDLEFNPLYHTNDYATQRGLEQMIYEFYDPPLNIYRPINPSNQNKSTYLQAALEFLERLLGGN